MNQFCGELENGFWPLDEGDWKMELEDEIRNYPADKLDLDTIQAFRDKELAADCWSDSISFFLLSIKMSPIFVIWHDPVKLCIVTDYTESGLNDGILQ